MIAVGKIKNGLKRILPPPVNSFMREVDRIVAMEEKNQVMIQQLLQRIEQQERQIKTQEKYAKQMEEKQQCTLNKIGQLQNESRFQKNQIVQIEKNMIKQMQQPILEYFRSL